MATYKGSGLVANRDVIRVIDPSLDARILEVLTDEERKVYETVVSVGKYPAPIAAAIFEKSASIVYPHDDEAVFKLAKERAKYALRGIYKIFLKVTTIPYLISKSTNLWTSFHDHGKVWIEKKEGENKASVFVGDYPEMIPVFIQAAAGFTVGAMELAGAKNIKIDIQAHQTNPWKWSVSWDESK